MYQYELFCKKYSRFVGGHLSEKCLKNGDVIKFKEKYYIIADLVFRTESKIRVEVWPAIIRLKEDLQDPWLLHWMQKNLLGLRIRLVGDENAIEGEVIDFWPGIRLIIEERSESREKPVVIFVEEYPDRVEILSVLTDIPNIADLSEFNSIQILGR